MELRHLRYFVAIATELNFTRAAKTVHVTQSTLSHQIRQLEEEIGYRLFERSGRSVALTSEGEILLLGVMRALKDLDEAIRSVKESAGGLTGKVRMLIGVHAFAVGIAPTCLEQFRLGQPNVQITMEEALSLLFPQRLASHDFDFGIGEKVDTAGYTFEPLYMEELGLMVSRSHPLARRKRIRMIELHRLPIALPTREIAARRIVDECLQSVGAEPNVVAEVSMVDSLFQIATQTSIAAVIAFNYFSSPDVVTIALEDPTPRRTIGFFWKYGSTPEAHVRLLADVIRQVVFEKSAQVGWPRIQPCGPPPSGRVARRRAYRRRAS